MTMKTIAVSEEVYQLLMKIKLPEEELEDTILRLCGVRARGRDFDSTFQRALEEVIAEDAELLKRLAQ
ncbi:MAG: hypothetical protein HXY34_12300 [Candidatus Thorarchaeota archaeon]|nr:hypothetical protein [Candidatus Thorarchaeota archaeon]